MYMYVVALEKCHYKEYYVFEKIAAKHVNEAILILTMINWSKPYN